MADTEEAPESLSPTVSIPAVESLVTQRIRERFGAKADPGVSLGTGPRAEGALALTDLVRREGEGSRYLLRNEVGRGGMGAVLSVFDTELRRTLAMKVLLEQEKGGNRDDIPTLEAAKVARFLEEAQVTAQLSHPGIVPVHELGIDESGRVYFTMRLVRGHNLREIFRFAQREEEGWTASRALGVLLKVCETMAYAHDKGVIHRDLKPANVMVGRYGEVYVMDWGLSRVEGREDSRDLRPRGTLEDTQRLETIRNTESSSGSPLVTVDGAVIGTPYYMPPEQAQGDAQAVGTRSDVYALGAMLYHLLVGKAPYSDMPWEGAARRPTAAAVLARVIQHSPTPIHLAAPAAPAELHAICETAMAREPDDRYPDTSTLADDLRAFLENRVVGAYRTGPMAEIKKWVVRNRGLAASLLSALILIVGGTATTSAVLAHKNRRVTSALQEADRVASFLVGLFESADPGLLPGSEPTARDLLDRGSRLVDEALQEEPAVRIRLRNAMGSSYLALGRLNEAEKQYKGAMAEAEAALGPLHTSTLASMNGLALSLIQMERLDEAEPWAIKALSGCRAAYGGDHPEAMSALNNLGLLHKRMGDLDLAEDCFSEALEKKRRVLGERASETLSTAHNLAAVYAAQGRRDEARALYDVTLELEREVLGNDHPRTLTTANNLGHLLGQSGDLEGSVRLHRSTLEARRRVLGDRHPETLRSLNNLAGSLLRSRQFAQAEPLYEEAIEGLRSLGQDGSRLLPVTLSNLASLHRALREDGKAIDDLTAALEAFLALDEKDSARVQRTRTKLAALLAEMDRFEEAEPVYRAALESGRRTLGEDHADTRVLLSNLALALQEQGKRAEAEPLLREALLAFRTAEGLDASNTLAVQFNLGTLLLRSGHPDEAAPLARDLVERTAADSPFLADRTALFEDARAALLERDG